MTLMVETDTALRLEARRAVEALRSGVPSAAAVRALGSGQEALEQRFRTGLDLLEERRQPRGLLVRGGFGAGKSHLLTWFEQIALDEGFAVSRVVISKETPLNVPVKLYRSAIENLRIPKTIGRGIDELGVLLSKSFVGPAFTELSQTLPHDRTLDSRFPATVRIFHLGCSDEDVADRILRFWSGDPLTVGDLNRYVRDLQIGDYKFGAMAPRELALQMFTFMPRLIRAAGLRGWVLLIDELELIGRYSRLARGQSYAELARLMGAVTGEDRPGLLMVGAITADFHREVLTDKGDLDEMVTHLNGRDASLSTLAERGMSLIQSAELLNSPGPQVLKKTYETLKILHPGAYHWMPPDVAWPEELQATPMRTFVRAWINAWDIRRLYPQERGDEAGYAIDEVPTDYRENPDVGGEDTAAD